MKYAETTNWKRVGDTISRQFGAVSGLLSAVVNVDILYFPNISTRQKNHS